MKNEKQESRIKKTTRNAIASVFCQIITVLVQFLVRTFFIHYLSKELLGLNGVFSNILSVLSLTELGLGTAIVCSMYSAMAKNDENEIRLYFRSYKKIYSIVGIIVAILGVSFLPFLSFLIADSSNIYYLHYYYLLYLFDVVVSYFFAHYRSLFSADQKEYVNNIVRTMFLILQTIFQIICLVLFKNFFLFLSIKIICNFLSGLVIAMIVKKKYPYITIKDTSRLSNDDKNRLKNDSIGVLSTRIELTVLNSTDNMIISSILGSVVAGIYSNYTLIIGSISTAIGLIFSATQASIGNYCVTKEKKDIETLFNRIHYIYYFIYGFCTSCLISLLNPFINLWIGKEYELSISIIFVVCTNFYVSLSRQANLSFITVNHLLRKLNIKNIVEAMINICISIILINFIGLIGVFLGTLISFFTCSIWYEPKVVYDYFEVRPFKYYINYFIRLLVVIFSSLVCLFISNVLYDGTLLRLILCFLINILISLFFVTVPFIRTKDFKYLFTSIVKMIHRRQNK